MPLLESRGSVNSQSSPEKWGFHGRERGTRHLQALRMLSAGRWLVGKKKKKPPISPPDSWKMSRMSQHSGVWVGSCVCLHSSISGVFSEFPAGRTLCPWGAENIPWGPSTAALLDLLCSQCMSVCRAGGQKWPEYPWDNGKESSGRSWWHLREVGHCWPATVGFDLVLVLQSCLWAWKPQTFPPPNPVLWLSSPAAGENCGRIYFSSDSIDIIP